MVYEDTCNSVDPSFVNETNDFLDECILLLNLLEKWKKNSEHCVSQLCKQSEYDAKRIFLYSWIAFSPVSEAHADVSAVAVYRLKGRRARVYYPKNNLNSIEQGHAKQLADLVRLAASTTMSVPGLQTKYFSILQKNCLGKLIRRVDDLRASVSLRVRPFKDGDVNLISAGS